MKKLKVFSIVLTVVSAIFLGYSLYLHYSLYVHRSYTKVKYLAIGNMLTELNPNYTKYFSSPPWYIQIAPDLILLAGITSVIIAFYLSPELRNSFKTLINKYRK